MRPFDGNHDPQDHLYEFNDLMELHQVLDLAKCRCLAVTLTSHAKRWLRSPLVGLISSWPWMSTTFLWHFQANRKFSMPLSYLSNIRQERDESLQSYINRFHRELNKVAHAPEESIRTLIIAGVRPQTELWKELQAEDDISLTRFYNLAEKYLQIENSLVALRRRDHGISSSMSGRGDNRRADRKGDIDDQRKGKKPATSRKNLMLLFLVATATGLNTLR